MVQVRNNKIIKKIDYLNKSGGRIDELMWVFCKNDSVKQKKQVFDVKQTESFKRADVNALKGAHIWVQLCKAASQWCLKEIVILYCISAQQNCVAYRPIMKVVMLEVRIEQEHL